MTRELYPYQRIGADWLASKKHALLADQMGLGKTVQAIMAAKQVGARRIAVVCPASVRANWHREFERWWPEFGADPFVNSYNMLVRGSWYGMGPEVLIIDEAHYLKNRDSKRTKAVYGKDGLATRARRVWLLSGTPAPNNPAELWTHLHALAPGLIMGKNGKPASWWGFVNRYCKTVDKGFGPQIVGGKNLDELKALMAPFILRRTKDEVLADLPPIRFNTLPIDGVLPSETAHDEMLVESALETGIESLAKVAMHVATLRRATGMAKLKGVIDWIKDFLESGEKLVVFAHHRDVIRETHASLREPLRGKIALVTGDTGARQAEVDRFQNDPDCRLFIGQIQAAGTGITLTAASTVLMVEQSWVPAENAQAAMRIHRIGQKNACVVYNAVLAGSIDERIGDALTRKMNDLVQLFGEV